MNKEYRICSRCVLDTSVVDIKFDDNNICNYCSDFINKSGHIVNRDDAELDAGLTTFVERVKKDGKGNQYDCIVGVSGGVDSSWALVQAVKCGLKPLAVHMDNGWNSELAQNNIENLVKTLNVDLHTHVINWNEYRSLMQAFFDADVIDIELLYDNAMIAVNYQLAAKYKVHWILSGGNQVTEGVRTPTGWNWFKRDKRNIKDIGKKIGNVKLDTFPAMGTFDYIYYEFIRGIKWVSFLDYFQFNKVEAMNILEKEYAYKPYPYKHYESVFTRFYQGYLLPNKFNVDKRKLHFSALIVSGQMDRSDAIKKLKEMPYISQEALDDDKEYFLKKMGWKELDLVEYLAREERSHLDFSSEKPLWDFCHGVHKRLVKR